MRNDQSEIEAIRKATLDDYLSRWHSWMQGSGLNGTDRLDDPSFKDARSYRGWQEADNVLDEEWQKFTMRTIDFVVGGDKSGQGGMPDPYKSAIYILARNCCTGRSVWISPRLPKDAIDRGIVIAEARKMLMQRLNAAGVPI